jgi:hypothetical protein
MAVGEERPTDASLGSSEGLEAVAEVVEAGDGLPALARAIGRALEASVAILDRSSSVLAVACASPSDERAVLEAREGVERIDLMVGGTPVGELRVRGRSGRWRRWSSSGHRSPTARARRPSRASCATCSRSV